MLVLACGSTLITMVILMTQENSAGRHLLRLPVINTEQSMFLLMQLLEITVCASDPKNTMLFLAMKLVDFFNTPMAKQKIILFQLLLPVTWFLFPVPRLK